jgi:hypothetical protein
MTRKKPMTAGALIVKLSRYPLDMPVRIFLMGDAFGHVVDINKVWETNHVEGEDEIIIDYKQPK